MQTDYNIEDLVFQTDELVVYRARTKNGIPHALIRLKYTVEVMDNLTEERFDKALEALRALDHSCLRPVLDGGIDPVDKSPWIAARWWEGVVLMDRIAAAPLTQEEFDRVTYYGESLVQEFGELAGAFSFAPVSIVTTRASDGQVLDTFSVDYHLWFQDWAMGYTPGKKKNPALELKRLLDEIRPASAEKKAPKTLLTTEAQASAPLQTEAVTEVSFDQGTKPKKTIAIVAALLGLVGGGIWLAGNLNKDEELADNEPEKTPQVETALPEKKTSPSKKQKAPKPTVAKVTKAKPKPKPPKVTKAEKPPKPSGGGLTDLEPTPASVKDLVGSWVILPATVATSADGRILTFEGLPDLKAEIAKGTTEAAEGDKVEVIGYLKSTTLLEVESEEDIEIEGKDAPMLKEVYTLEDEAQLRKMGSATVTVRAKVTGFATSTSGKTLYLVFRKERPGFRAGVVRSQADASLDEEYLKTFVGKEILVTGQISAFELRSRIKRLVINFYDKDALKLAE